MKKLIVVSIVILFVFMGGCTPNTGETTPESQSPDITLVFDHDLVGKTLEETIDILLDSELEYEVIEAYNETYEQGLVIFQSIAPQSEIDETSKMVLTVSKGSEFVLVPDVVAMTGDEAIEILEGKLLTHLSTETNSMSVNEGLVISQDPLPGTSMKIGSTVTLNVSLGPRKVQMIDLTDHSEAYAISFFDEAKLIYQISYSQSNSIAAGKVISQSVPGGKYASEDKTVYILISTGMVEFMVDDYTGRALGEVTSLLSGKCVVETRLDYNPAFADCVIIGQSIEAGNSVIVDSRIVLTVNNWDERPVSFVDAGLEQLVRNQINKQSGVLLYSDVKDIGHLINYDVPHDKIRTLEGIENLTSLQSLYLFGENITDVSPLAELTELRYLNVERNNIQDISSLSGLVNLINFAVSANPISDISILANMPDLEGVSLSGCPVDSISVISNFTNIDFLNISNTNVPAQEAWDVVSGFTRLRALHITGIKVESLDFLQCQSTLKYLSADFCELKDIECLSDFKYLQNLKIYHNEIEDISPLSNLSYLESLLIGFNDIVDLSVLESLENINYLFISDIKTSDFSVLASLKKLKSLHISDNIIDNVEFLRPLVKLEMLEICSDILDLTNYYEIIDEHKARGCEVISDY